MKPSLMTLIAASAWGACTLLPASLSAQLPPPLILKNLMTAPPPEAALQTPFAAEEYTLPNGLKVFLVPNPSSSNVFGAVAVRAGGKYDPANATGMAHYLEHMCFKGTQELGTRDYAAERVWLSKIDSLYEVLGKTTDPEARKQVQALINENAVKAAEYAIPNEMDRLLSSIGSEGLNAFTTQEIIVYHNSFPHTQMERWLDLYAHRFQKPVFRLFQSELETVYEEKNISMDGMQYRIFTDINENLFKNHPYGKQDVLGQVEHLKNPSLTQMYAYYEKYFVAGNMCLILSGNFSPADVLPLVEKSFGALPAGKPEAFPVYAEAPFHGREFHEVKYTPIKLGVMAYRTVPEGHPDQAALDVAGYLLNNESQTGALDKLSLERKVLQTMSLPYVQYDHGANIIIFIPKLIGQSLEEAESLAVQAIGTVKAGAFSDSDLNAARLALLRDLQTELESNQGRALRLANLFARGTRMADLPAYIESLRKVTREDVLRVVNQYYGENKLVFWSKMGFPKKEKLEKPGYKAPLPKGDAESAYAKHFKAIPASAAEARPIQFETDATHRNSMQGVQFWKTPNPVNDVFSVNLRFGMGTHADPLADALAYYVPRLDAEGMSAADFRKQMAALGSVVGFSAEYKYFEVNITGFDENLEATMAVLGTWMDALQPSPEQWASAVEEVESERKFADAEPSTRGEMLRDYARLGDQSPWLLRPGMKTLKKTDAQDALAVWDQIRQTVVTVHYCGNQDAEAAETAINLNLFSRVAPVNPADEVPAANQLYDGTEIWFMPQKNAIQSQIYFYRNMGEWNTGLNPAVAAFNEYFGTGMSGLVFQEIREFRSLAYSAYAAVRRPQNFQTDLYLDGYIGCQADKSLESITVMLEMLRTLPQKPERMPGIRASLVESLSSFHPGFRNVSQTIVQWQQQGFTQDPRISAIPAFENMQFADLVSFWETHIKPGEDDGNGLRILIAGDPARLDVKALEKIAPVRMIKLDQVMTE